VTGNIRIGMVAGEASGDQLAAHLMLALRDRRASIAYSGIGGPKMAAEGFASAFPMQKLSVRGYSEALRHYREIMAIRRELGDQLIRERPNLFIGVDSSDFNLGLERRLKDAGIPAVHYVSPAVWAWRRWRVRRIARSVNHILCMFPFEKPLYDAAGVPATYVGHPLADMIPLEPKKDEAKDALRLPPRKLVVAMLPGSRRSELEHMAAPFVLAAHRLRQEVPDIHFIVPMVTRETRDMFERTLYEQQQFDLPLTLMFGHSHEALAAADLALVASGTATLETALFKTPMVITYKQSALSWFMMRRMLYLPYVGMPNILAGERIVPELLQGEATPGALAAALLALLGDTAAQKRQLARFHDIHHLLRQNTAEKAADALLRVMDRSG
jgi:lipid-A-disaccharide synthase